MSRSVASVLRLAISIVLCTISTAAAVANGEVNLYSYRDAQRIEPLLRAFGAATRITVNITFAAEGLIERIVGEGEQSPADVLLTADFWRLLEARRLGLTQALKSPLVEGNLPSLYRDPEGHWFGLTRRARVFVVSAERVGERAVTYEELAEPRWKGKLCIRSGKHPYNVGLAAAMLAHHGPKQTETWLRGVAANLARKPSGGDRDQIRGVMTGACDFALVNSYYAAELLSVDRNSMRQKQASSIRVLFPNAADRGTHVSISGVALMKHSRNKTDGIKLIEFLTSTLAQRIYSAVNAEYPVNEAVPVPSVMASWERLKPDSLPLHKIAEAHPQALTLIEAIGFDQGPDSTKVADAPVAGTLARTKIKFALDWRFEGQSAPFFVAIDKGYYEKEGLDVAIDPGNGSVESVDRVASRGYDMGFADLNSLIRYRAGKDSVPVKAVMMGYDAPAFAIVTLKKNRIEKPKDLEGKVLGAPDKDGAYAQWPIFAMANNLDVSKIRIENVDFQVREQMLIQGKVAAITGFWFSSLLNLTAKGVAPDNIVVLLMRDYGLDLYGNAVIVNPAFMTAHPKAVAGFVRATVRGLQDTIKSPEMAIKSVISRNTAADERIELQRLKMALAKNYVTEEVLSNGLGGVDPARLTHSILQVGATFPFANRPKAADIFTTEFLPPKELRRVEE